MAAPLVALGRALLAAAVGGVGAAGAEGAARRRVHRAGHIPAQRLVGGFAGGVRDGHRRFPQLKEINGLFAFLLHFADKTVVDFNLLGAGVAFVFYGFMDDNLLDQGIQQFGSQF